MADPGCAIGTRPHLGTMDLPLPEPPTDPTAQARHDHRRFWRAALASAAFVALLAWIHLLEGWMGHSLRALAVHPQQLHGLVGVLTAPLLHGSFAHLAANSFSLLVLGTLAGVLYPRALVRALPLVWLGSGLFVWIVGRDSAHLGASGLTHGLMFFVFVSGLLRRDRPAVAGSLIAFFLYGGMVLTVLPREVGVSWESHMGGALFGLVAAVLWRRLDPAPKRRRYSWEIEAEQEAALEDALAAEQRGMFERRPDDVPVLWDGPTRARDSRGQVIPFRRGNGGGQGNGQGNGENPPPTLH